MLGSTIADVTERLAQVEPAAFGALKASVRRQVPITDHLLDLWLDGLHEAYVAADVSLQDRARMRLALVELRAYAGLPA